MLITVFRVPHNGFEESRKPLSACLKAAFCFPIGNHCLAGNMVMLWREAYFSVSLSIFTMLPVSGLRVR